MGLHPKIGSVSMGIADSQCSPLFFQKYLGMRDEWVDMTEVLRRMALKIYDVYSVMANWGANHGVTVYGHIGGKVLTLCSMLRISVTMHNVEEERIFRPHAWGMFGTKDLEATDMNACQKYGPLYA